MFTKRKEKKSPIDLQLCGSISLGGCGLGLIVLAATGMITPVGLAIFAALSGVVFLSLATYLTFSIFDDFFSDKSEDNSSNKLKLC